MFSFAVTGEPGKPRRQWLVKRNVG